MYPEGVLQWLGYLAVVFGVLALVAVLALSIHGWARRRHTLHPDPGDEIPDRLDDLPD